MKKDVIIAILGTFCLTATLFMVGFSVGYDPWADTNDDGKIDMKDIGYTAKLFGTTGDSTKNVTVTNWPERHKSVAYVVDQMVPLSANPLILEYSFGVPNIDVEGYSRMSVYIQVWGFDVIPGVNVQFGVRDLYWANYGVRVNTADDPVSDNWWPYFNCTLGNRTYTGMQTFETFGPSVEITLGAFSPTQSFSFRVTMTVYLRNE